MYTNKPIQLLLRRVNWFYVLLNDGVLKIFKKNPGGAVYVSFVGLKNYFLIETS
jgi:hypothetical protein